MLANGFVFFTVIGLLARGSLADITCYPKTSVDKKECHSAISQIIYQKNGLLGPESKSFGYIDGSCSIIVVNEKGATPTRKQIEDGFEKILDKCQPGTGGGNLQSDERIFLNIGNRGTKQYAPWESDFPFLKETCGLNTNAPDTHNDDCLKAYKSIPLSVEGQFLSDTKAMTNKITKTYATCTVLIYTSDQSNLVASRMDVDPVFEKLIQDCNGKSGVVSLKEGAQGQNGRVFLKTRHSMPCGVKDPHKQVCN